jgi:hypothetical protein
VHAQHIEHTLSLGLPESDAEPIKRLSVIANGPSASLFPFAERGQWRLPTLAVNGALKPFTDHGKAPKFWAACDPQELVANFLNEIPEETVYLVASKCHPAVFRRLRNRDVRVWHINDHPATDGLRRVPVASSVTLCIISHMHRAYGYRAFETYGWDACYGENGQHHANQSQQTNTSLAEVTLTIGAHQVQKVHKIDWLDWLPQPHWLEDTFEGGRAFKTNSTWAVEAQDAVMQLHDAPYTVKVHGDGMIKAILAEKGIGNG